jgi:hypothetical protein
MRSEAEASEQRGCMLKDAFWAWRAMRGCIRMYAYHRAPRNRHMEGGMHAGDRMRPSQRYMRNQGPRDAS